MNRESFYLVRWPNITMIRFGEKGLMTGEDIFNGAPIRVQEIGRDDIDMLVDGPLLAA